MSFRPKSEDIFGAVGAFCPVLIYPKDVFKLRSGFRIKDRNSRLYKPVN